MQAQDIEMIVFYSYDVIPPRTRGCEVRFRDGQVEEIEEQFRQFETFIAMNGMDPRGVLGQAMRQTLPHVSVQIYR